MCALSLFLSWDLYQVNSTQTAVNQAPARRVYFCKSESCFFSLLDRYGPGAIWYRGQQTGRTLQPQRFFYLAREMRRNNLYESWPRNCLGVN
jgi:hypothetical protein